MIRYLLGRNLRGLLTCLLLLTTPGVTAAPLKITIASDSTAAHFPPADPGGRWGWGQAFGAFFTTNVIVDDLAASGRSSKSFYDQGKWARCLATHADYYFIQFGHNDGKTADPARYTAPETSFKGYLSNYVNQARTAKGIPVLLTPPTRRHYLRNDDHKIKPDDLEAYARATREVATNLNVPLLDVLPDSVAFYERIGETNAPAYQAANTHVTPPAPGGDETHFSPKGAREHCALIIHRLLESTDPRLAPLQAEVRKEPAQPNP